MAIADQSFDFEQLMLASIFDKLSWLCWANTKDGQKNRRRPESIAEKLLQKQKVQNDIKAFNAGEDFEIKKAEILKKGE